MTTNKLDAINISQDTANNACVALKFEYGGGELDCGSYDSGSNELVPDVGPPTYHTYEAAFDTTLKCLTRLQGHILPINPADPDDAWVVQMLGINRPQDAAT